MSVNLTKPCTVSNKPHGMVLQTKPTFTRVGVCSIKI
jgi:hypothetical protein